MRERLRIGIIGFGGAGIAQHSHFSAMADCEVTAVYNPDRAGLARAGERCPRALITDDLDAFLGSKIDAVAVCSPDRTHASYIARCLLGGKHVVCEKPLTDSVEGCREILRAESKAAPCVAAVQHQMRFLPVHIKMKEIIQRGELGRISYLEGYYVHDLRKRASAFDDWRFKDNATPLVYAGCHFIDLLRWLIADEVEEVMAMANHRAFPEYPESDLNVVLLRFRSGVIGKVVIAFGAGRPQDHSVRVYGTEKSIENNLLFSKAGDFGVFARPQVGNDPWLAKNPMRTLANLARRWSAPTTGWLMEALMKLQGNRHPYYQVNAYPLRLYEHASAVRTSLESFVESIRSGKRVECTMTDAAKTVVTCLAGVDSFRRNQPVRVADYWIPEFGPK